jgi:hypothetical protein
MLTQAQGEVYARRIDKLPSGVDLTPMRPTDGRLIVAHSESGHHHTFAASSVEVLERPATRNSAGVEILYAIVKEPATLDQHAASPHGSLVFDPGIYELRIAREYDPLMEMARRVAD